MNCVAIIPARGGSVRVPQKNIKSLKGEPLIVHTIQQALESKICDKVIVSTDDDTIALISALNGAEILNRPKDLAGDVESELVIQNAVQQLEEINYKPDIVVMLQCTSPLRKPETIRKCVLTLLDNWKICNSVITVSPITHRPEWMGCLSDDMFFIPYTTTWGTTVRLVASQSLPKLYAQNGCVYAFKRDLIMNECTIISSTTKVVIIDEKEAFDIDLPIDFVIAEQLMSEG